MENPQELKASEMQVNFKKSNNRKFRQEARDQRGWKQGSSMTDKINWWIDEERQRETVFTPYIHSGPRLTVKTDGVRKPRKRGTKQESPTKLKWNPRSRIKYSRLMTQFRLAKRQYIRNAEKIHNMNLSPEKWPLWAMRLLGWTITWQKRALQSEGSVIQTKVKKNHPDCSVSSVMLWGCFSALDKGYLHFCDDSINA